MPPVEPSTSPAVRREQAPPQSFGPASPPPIPPILSAAPNIVALLRALGRRWMLALFVAVLGAGLTWVLVMALMPAPYTASTRIVFDRRPPGYLMNEQSGDMTGMYRSQIPVFRSKEVLNQDSTEGAQLRVLLPSDPAERYEYLDKTLTVEVPSNQEVLRITAAGDDPKEMADLVNKLVAAYIQSLRDRTKAHEAQLKKENDEVERQLSLKRQGLMTRNFARITELERDLQRIESERRKARADLEVLQAREATIGTVPDSEIEEYLRGDTEYYNLQVQFVRLQKQIDGIASKSKYGDEDPQLARPKQEREAIQLKLNARRDAIKPQAQAQYTLAMKEYYKQEAIRYGAVLKSLEKQEIEARGALTEASGSKSEMAEYQRMVTEIQGLENTVKRISGERTNLEIANKDPKSWLRVLGDATPPNSRTRDKQFKFGGVATGAVFFALLALVAFVEFRAQRLNSTDEVVQGLGLPLVGTIPALPARVRSSPTTTNPKDAYWQNQLTEAIDALRTFLIRTAHDQPCVVMVTSAVAGEGKTSLASQLAASLARAWRKTILVDGDLRKPAAHKLFELPQEPGLSEVLRGEMDAADVVRPTPLSRLWLMPAGQWDPHALQALAQEGVGNLFRQLKEEYDFVIVDSCPVLPVADTLLLGQQADTVLFSSLRGHTRLPTLYAAQQRLQAIDIPILGVVVIGARGTLGGLDIQYPRPNA